MDETFPPDLVRHFEELSRAILGDATTAVNYDDLCRHVVSVIDGCDHASLLLVKKRPSSRTGHDARAGVVHTAGASDDIAAACDRLEQELDEGPCLDALDPAHGDLHQCPDLTDAGREGRWPRLVEQLLATTPVRGVAGVVIRTDGETLGALNVFATKPGALTQTSLHQAAVLAAFASIALVAAREKQQAATMREGLASNRVIGKAIGLLMSSYGLTDDAAFRTLTQLSQDMNVKLSKLATDLVAKHDHEHSGPPQVPPVPPVPDGPKVPDGPASADAPGAPGHCEFR